jgi:cell division transport system ATP-binding protein
MIQLYQVHKLYDNNLPALVNISLRIEKGDFVFITGASGAGKTTLIKLIFSAERPTKGEIIVNGVNLSRANSSAIPLLRRKIGVVFQDFKLLHTRTVFDNVAFSLEVIGASKREVKRKVWQALKWVGLLQKKDSYPLRLSGGEQQRVAIARAVINNPILLLADEPTGNLDVDLSLDIMKLFRAINARGTTVVIATHNRRLAESFSDKIISLDHGHLRDQ